MATHRPMIVVMSASQMPAAWIEKTRYPSGTCLNFTKGIDIRDYAEKITDIILEG